MRSRQAPVCTLYALLLSFALVAATTLLVDADKESSTKSFVNLPPEWSGWIIANGTNAQSGRIYFNWDLNMKRIDSQMVTGGVDWQTTLWDYNTATVTTLTPNGACRQAPITKAPGLPELLYAPEIKSTFLNYTAFNGNLVSYSVFNTPLGDVGVYTDIFIGSIVHIVGLDTNEVYQGVSIAPQDLDLFLVPSIYGACDGSVATAPRISPSAPSSFQTWVTSLTNNNINGTLYVDWNKGFLRFDQMQSGTFSLTLVDQSKQTISAVVSSNSNAFICSTSDIADQTNNNNLLSSTIIAQIPAILTPTGISGGAQWQGIKSVYGHLCNWWTYAESGSNDNNTVTTTVYQDVFTQDIVSVETQTLGFANVALLEKQFYLFSLPSEWDCTGEDVSEEVAQFVQYPEWILSLEGRKINQNIYVDATHKLLRTDHYDIVSGVLTIEIVDYNQEIQWTVRTESNKSPSCFEVDEAVNSSFIIPPRTEGGWEWERLVVVDGRLCNEWNDSIGAVLLFEEVTTGELLRLINQTNGNVFDTVSYSEGEVNLRYFSLPDGLDDGEGNCNLSGLNSGKGGVSAGWVVFIAFIMLILGSVLGVVASRYIAKKPTQYNNNALSEPLLNP